MRHWRFKTNTLDTKWREWQRKTSLILLFMRRAEGGETGHFLRCFREARAGAEQPRMPPCGNLGHSRRPGHARRKMAQVAVPDFSVRGKPESNQKSHITYTSQWQSAHREAPANTAGNGGRYKSQTKANSTTTAKTARLNHESATKTNSKANIASPGLGIDCSFVTQGHHWVDAHGAPRWNIERRECGEK